MASMGDAKRTYSQQEVTEILKRALRQQGLREQELAHDDLVQMAGEVGIDRDALERATAELAQTQAEELARTNESRELSEERGRQLQRFTSSLVTFGVAALVYFLVAKKLGLPVWVLWVLIGWGALVLLRLRHVLFPQERLQRRKRRQQRWLAREQRRAQHRAAAAHVAAEVPKEFERVVQAGVAALLGVAARKIEEHAGRKAGRRP